MTNKMSKELVLNILTLKENGMSQQEIATQYGVSFRTIQYWVRRLREEGFEVKNNKPKGRQAMKLRD